MYAFFVYVDVFAYIGTNLGNTHITFIIILPSYHFSHLRTSNERRINTENKGTVGLIESSSQCDEVTAAFPVKGLPCPCLFPLYLTH